MSPSLALWLSDTYEGIIARSVYVLGYRDAKDFDIFLSAKETKAAIMTKDSDFIKLLHAYGPPPQIIWVTAGNTTNAKMRSILNKHMYTIIELLKKGEELIEITG